MVKLLFLFMGLNLLSQESVLLQNMNVDAKELNHGLNATNDSLVLSSGSTIFKVEIFNSGFMKSWEVAKNEVKIPLHEVPLGRFTVGAFVNRKVILMTLLREEPYQKKTETAKIVMERDSIVYDTIWKKTKLNIHRVVIEENETNVTYDTIRYSTTTERNITVKYVPYDLSTLGNDWTIIKQSREDYRDKNLRPNGKPYEN